MCQENALDPENDLSTFFIRCSLVCGVTRFRRWHCFFLVTCWKESRSICFRTTCRFNRHGGSLLVPANVVDPHSGGNRQAWSRDILLFLWFMYAAVGSVSLLTVLELVSGSRSGDDFMRPSPVRFEFSQRLFSIIQRYMFSAGARDLERSLCQLF